MCGLNGIQKGNYLGEEPIGKAEVEVRAGKLKNGKATCKEEMTGKIIKGEVTGWWIGSGGYVIQPERDKVVNKNVFVFRTCEKRKKKEMNGGMKGVGKCEC